MIARGKLITLEVILLGTNFKQSDLLEEKEYQFHFPQPEIYSPQIRESESGRQLWPREQYRKENQLAQTQLVRKLWSYYGDQSWEAEAEPQIIRKLWPRDAYRPATQREEQQIIRHLWGYYHKGGTEDDTLSLQVCHRRAV